MLLIANTFIIIPFNLFNLKRGWFIKALKKYIFKHKYRFVILKHIFIFIFFVSIRYNSFFLWFKRVLYSSIESTNFSETSVFFAIISSICLNFLIKTHEVFQGSSFSFKIPSSISCSVTKKNQAFYQKFKSRIYLFKIPDRWNFSQPFLSSNCLLKHFSELNKNNLSNLPSIKLHIFLIFNLCFSIFKDISESVFSTMASNLVSVV